MKQFQSEIISNYEKLMSAGMNIDKINGIYYLGINSNIPAHYN